MDLGIRDKVAIVLAASKGLGCASAAALASEGANVIIGSRNKEALEQAASVIERSTGRPVMAVPTDVTRLEDIKMIVERTVQTFGHVDILVNNAGGPPPGIFEALHDAQWQSAFELNLLSTIRFIRLVLPYMRLVGGGRIINIVSISVKQPIDGLILSNVIRPSMVGLAKTLSIELGSDHITVNNVCPGLMLTDRLWQTTNLKEKLAQGMNEQQILDELAKDIPMGRIGKPQELGALVAFLASKQAEYITGTTIQIDGGLVRSML
jgi:3-oxoacyl-[acyl-carrier protein] reductase